MTSIRQEEEALAKARRQEEELAEAIRQEEALALARTEVADENTHDKDLAELVDMGFDPEQVEQALRNHGGNKEAALDALMTEVQKGSKMADVGHVEEEAE